MMSDISEVREKAERDDRARCRDTVLIHRPQPQSTVPQSPKLSTSRRSLGTAWKRFKIGLRPGDDHDATFAIAGVERPAECMSQSHDKGIPDGGDAQSDPTISIAFYSSSSGPEIPVEAGEQTRNPIDEQSTRRTDDLHGHSASDEDRPEDDLDLHSGVTAEDVEDMPYWDGLEEDNMTALPSMFLKPIVEESIKEDKRISNKLKKRTPRVTQTKRQSDGR
ncbi:hypothetical protein NX059_010731 [Plenodomus lindquistii]|nr:hypothetical protein NX059_010731 [Plenodomus lindquistii]